MNKGIFIVILIIILLSQPGQCTKSIDYNTTITDKKGDTVYFEMNNYELEFNKCDNKPHLDLKSVSSREDNNNITFRLELYGKIKNKENIKYEIQGWFNDNSFNYSIFNFILSYSNKITTLEFDNNTVLTVTNKTIVGMRNLTVKLSKELFPNPTQFNFQGQCSEYDSEKGRNYLDSTQPIEIIVKDPPLIDTQTFFLILGVIFLIFVLVALKFKGMKSIKTSSKKRCSTCGGTINKKQEFCYSCGENLNKK